MSKSTQSLAKGAIKDPQLLSELLEGILSKKDAVRFENSNALLLLSEEQQSITKNIKESAYRLNLARARGPVG